MDYGDADWEAYRQAREAAYRDAALSYATRSAAFAAAKTPLARNAASQTATCPSASDYAFSTVLSWPVGLAIAMAASAWYYWPYLGPEILGIDCYGMPYEQELRWLLNAAKSIVLGLFRTCFSILWLVLGLTLSALRSTIEYAIGLTTLVIYSLRPRTTEIPIQFENLWYTHEAVLFRQRLRAVRLWFWNHTYHALTLLFVLILIGQMNEKLRRKAEELEKLDVREFHVPHWVIRAQARSQNGLLYDGSSSHYVPEHEVADDEPIEWDVWVERAVQQISTEETILPVLPSQHAFATTSESLSTTDTTTESVESASSHEMTESYSSHYTGVENDASSHLTIESIESTSSPAPTEDCSSCYAGAKYDASPYATTESESTEGSHAVEITTSSSSYYPVAENDTSSHTTAESVASSRPMTRVRAAAFCSACRQRHCCEVHA